MGNFMSDVGRSNISGSIRDLINSKIALDTNERADVRSANESALNAEQVIQAKRQNEAAAEKVKYDNTPLAINSFSDSIEGGPEGPIFKHLYSKAKAQGLIDESNPNNPTIKRKHINEDMKKIFAEDAMQINTMRIDMLNSQKQALLAEKAKKPDDEKINASIESINVKLNQATMHDDGLKKMAELKNAADIQAAHDVKANEVAKIQADATIKGHQISADAVREAAKEKRANESSKTAMERAWHIKRSEPGSEDLSLEDFKKNYWEKDKTTGELSESAALKLLQDAAMASVPKGANFNTWVSKFQKSFYKYRKAGLNSGDAYDKVLTEMQAPSGTEPSGGTKAPGGTKDYGYLWK